MSRAEQKLVVGIDSSTQSTKVLCVEHESGQIRSQGYAAHPDGTAVDPRAWTQALHQAWREAGLTDPRQELQGVEVIGAGVGAQQHGMVALDDADQPVFDALLWNDTRSAPQAEAMVADLGAHTWAQRTGIVPCLLLR